MIRNQKVELMLELLERNGSAWWKLVANAANQNAEVREN